jgi:hypothetical protein
MNILNNFSIDADFWEVNPQLKVAFSGIAKKRNSSKIMWAMALVFHPDSKFSNTSLEYRIKTVQEDYLKKVVVDWDDYKEEIEKFQHLTMTKAQRTLYNWEMELEKRAAFLSAIDYDISTDFTLIEFKEKLLASTEKLWKQLRTCMKDVQDETAKSQTKGGAVKSASEEGTI